MRFIPIMPFLISGLVVPGLRFLGLALLGLVASGLPPAAAAQTEVTSRIDEVVVYPDGARVTRVIEVDLPRGDSVLRAADFPPALDAASLRVEGEAAARLAIGGVDARPPRADRPPLDPALEDSIEALRDERARLDGKIAAATARHKFVEGFAERSPAGIGDKGEARPLAEWRAAFAAVEDEVASAEKTIGEARVLQRDIDRKLARLEAERTANPPRKMEVRIDVAVEAAAHATLRVSYAVTGARWSPLYDARLDTGKDGRKPALDLVRRAEIVQTTGEDWTDVELAVSTARTAKGGNAPELRPLIVGYTGGDRVGYTRGHQEDKYLAQSRAPAPPADKIAAEEQEAPPDTGTFQAVYRIPGRVNISASEGGRNLRISSATIAPDLKLRAAPAVDATAFLEAGFKQPEGAPLLPGQVALYRDGNYVGRSLMAMTAKGEDVRLGFGADDSVKIVRSKVGQVEGSAGLLGSAKTARREFKTTIRNGHETSVRIVVEDRVPVSEADEVTVELLPVTTPPSEKEVRGRRGIMAWSLDLAPGETRDLRIAWLVRWPADKTVVYTPGH